jgi:uncharacterized membrane protein YoaK (UPF0700 family)
MNTLDARARRVAIVLSALAGFVDALGFLELGGFFVSFMSGNTTRLGVGLASAMPEAWIAAGLMLVFTLGVTAGVVTGRRAGAHRPTAVLGVTSGALAIGAFLSLLPAPLGSGLCLAFAMGAMNAVFEREGKVRVGLTYMTGALVGLGQRLADLLTGQKPEGWSFLAFLWLGMAVGACAGAASYPLLGLQALGLPAAVAAGLALFLWRRPLA